MARLPGRCASWGLWASRPHRRGARPEAAWAYPRAPSEHGAGLAGVSRSLRSLHLASDFATLTTATLRTCYLVFLLEIGARHADSLGQDAGTKVIRLPVRSPDLNGYAERWIRSLRQERLDRIIILNEAHLRWVVGEYVRYYNQRRPHQVLQ